MLMADEIEYRMLLAELATKQAKMASYFQDFDRSDSDAWEQSVDLFYKDVSCTLARLRELSQLMLLPESADSPLDVQD